MLILNHHFKQAHSPTSQKWRLEQERQRQTERKQQERKEERASSDLLSAASDALLASDQQVQAMQQRLATYETATVAALMDNQEELDAVQAKIDAMLATAHVMPDGRRVFRTEDGMQVFDEDGQEVSAEELDPMLITPTSTTWEAYQVQIQLRDTLNQERQEILDYQEKLDAARERLDEGLMSLNDLEALEADLDEAMPISVREHTGIENVAKQNMENVTENNSYANQINGLIIRTTVPTINGP